MSLQAPTKLQKLQQTLHAKAKESPEFRFYALYDKIYREDILAHAYRLARHNGGKPGVDGEDFSDIEAYGVERWLGERAQALKEKRYRASPVRRVYIPKPNGKQRPLGIPTIRDRVVQTAAVLVLAPIFEADLQPEQYAYREGRNAHDAVRHVHKLLNTGYTDVIDADLSGYFDTIPHAELMQSVARRISDRHVLALIKQWLVAAVEEDDGRGRRSRTTRRRTASAASRKGRRSRRCSATCTCAVSCWGGKRWGWRIAFMPGSSILPMISSSAAEERVEQAMDAMRAMMDRLKLTVNEAKTGRCRIPQEHFDFLGYTFGRCYSTKTGRAYIGTRPSQKSVKKVCRTISEATSRRWLLNDSEDRVVTLNRILVGWANYFSLGPVSKAYRAVDGHATERLRRWLRKKHKQPGQGTARFPDEHLYDDLGLQRLSVRTRDFPWAKA